MDMCFERLKVICKYMYKVFIHIKTKARSEFQSLDVIEINI